MTPHDWNPNARYDVKAILLAVWLPCLFWLVAAGGAAVFGFPGVICITPLGWLMGINVGQRAVQYSANPDSSKKLMEAAFGGFLLGMFQGLLATLIVAFASPLGAGEDEITNVFSALILFLMVGGFGGTICAGLAVLFGRQLIRKMERDGV